MDRRIRRLGIALTGLFLLLCAQLAYVQVFAADRIKNDPANARRQIIAEYKVERGPILTWDGHVMAESLPNEDRSDELRFQRSYPEGPLFAALTGYYSRVVGRSGLEQSMNDYLSGDAPELAISTFTDLVLGRPKEGAPVMTTVLRQMQIAAREALGDNRGAIVAVEPQTGSVIALVGNPTFDPNVLSSGSSAEIQAAWDDLNNMEKHPEKPLLSPAKDELYLPGSTGKIVTAAAALENGMGPDFKVPNPRELDLPQTDIPLTNFGGSVCAGGIPRVSMAQAFQQSCNVPFAELALDEIGAEGMSGQALDFGFCMIDPPDDPGCDDPAITTDVPFENGRFPQASYFADRQPMLAYSGIGLDNVQTNPFHLALITSAVANGGTQMNPRLVCEVRDPQGRVVRKFGAGEFGRPISSASASALTRMMLSVTQPGGTAATAFAGTPYGVAGKTGTATNGTGRPPNAWFTGFAPAGDGQRPRIAVAVIVLDGGSLSSDAATGGAIAAPIAREVIDAYLSYLAETGSQGPCVT